MPPIRLQATHKRNRSVIFLLFLATFGATYVCAMTAEAQTVVNWSQIHLRIIYQQMQRNALSPPAVGRALAVHMTCVWDAVAPYTDNWTSVVANDVTRKPESDRTDRNRAMAASKAAYNALMFLHNATCSDCLAEARNQLISEAIDPTYDGTDLANPVGVANVACGAVLRMRRRDGSNQFGDDLGAKFNAAFYSDTSNFAGVNPPSLVGTGEGPLCDCSSLRSINHWQPLTLHKGDGTTMTQVFAASHWASVTPFGLKTADQFRPPPPPMFGTTTNGSFVDEFREVVRYSTCLLYTSDAADE